MLNHHTMCTCRTASTDRPKGIFSASVTSSAFMRYERTNKKVFLAGPTRIISLVPNPGTCAKGELACFFFRAHLSERSHGRDEGVDAEETKPCRANKHGRSKSPTNRTYSGRRFQSHGSKHRWFCAYDTRYECVDIYRIDTANVRTVSVSITPALD